jgi:NTP pyrophosphatase (non-canonical NTP hydrolase)
MVTEECAELIVALRHFDRGKCSREELLDEVADVLICCHQLSLILGEAAVNDQIALKMNRLTERVNEDDPNMSL